MPYFTKVIWPTTLFWSTHSGEQWLILYGSSVRTLKILLHSLQELESIIQDHKWIQIIINNYVSLIALQVYIVGFGPEHTEKFNKIINLSGATRYDNFSDRVTHILVGDLHSHEVKLLKNKGLSCPMVTLQWLVDSIENEQTMPEEKYLISSSFDRSDITSSPLSKKVQYSVVIS